MTGMYSLIWSRMYAPVLFRRISLSVSQMATGTSGITYQYFTNQREMAMSSSVIHGSFILKSSKIFSNFGMMKIMMNARIGDGDRDDDARVDHGALDAAGQALGLFLELGQAAENDFEGAARLAGLDHVDVEAVEALGVLAERLATACMPDSTSSTTSMRAFLSTPGFIWPSRILRLRSTGRPASCRAENWRVKVTSCLLLDAAEGDRPCVFLPLCCWTPFSSCPSSSCRRPP